MVIVEMSYLKEVEKNAKNVFDRFVLKLLEEKYMIGLQSSNDREYRYFSDESLRIFDRLNKMGVLEADKIAIVPDDYVEVKRY